LYLFQRHAFGLDDHESDPDELKHHHAAEEKENETRLEMSAQKKTRLLSRSAWL
jgi:hypothetical protein